MKLYLKNKSIKLCCILFMSASNNKVNNYFYNHELKIYIKFYTHILFFLIIYVINCETKLIIIFILIGIP